MPPGKLEAYPTKIAAKLGFRRQKIGLITYFFADLAKIAWLPAIFDRQNAASAPSGNYTGIGGQNVWADSLIY